MALVTAMPLAHGSDEHLYQDTGLKRLPRTTCNRPSAKDALSERHIRYLMRGMLSRRQTRRDKGQAPTSPTGAKSAPNRNGWGLGWRAVRVRLQRRIHHIECWRRYAEIAAQRYYFAGEPRQLQSVAAQ